MKSGYVALLGLPNAGKSTLVNAMVGEKVSIVTAKPQTTRTRILGIVQHLDQQIIFVDSPGWVESTSGLNPFLQQELLAGIKDADALLVVLNLDAASPEAFHPLLEAARGFGKPWLGVITKSDLKLNNIEDRKRVLRQMLEPREHIVGSVLREPARMKNEILSWLEPHLPEVEQFYFPEDEYTGQTLRQMSAEVVREKCFEFLHQEIPYGLAVRIEKFEEGAVAKIFAEILLDRENHKGMVIGRRGEMLGRIGTAARQELERLLQQKVFLKLHVHVEPGWLKNQKRLKELGYVLPQ